MKIKGRIWVLTDKEGKKIDDIDTDMIFHNKYLAITEIEKMGQYTLDNLENWEDFSTKAKQGDIVITGENFGSGSSRAQAVDCFKALGITLLIAESFGAIYKRNAINSAFPIMTAKDIMEAGFKSGEEIEADTKTGIIKNLTTNIEFQATPFSGVQTDIMGKGSLFEYGKSM